MHTHALRSLFASALLVPMTALAVGTVDVADTIAGLGTDVTLTGWNAAENVALTVEPPMGPSLTRSVTTDPEGKGSVRLEGDDVELSGPYVLRAQGADGTVSARFDVLSEGIDAQGSTMQAAQSMVQPGGSTDVSVILRDRYMNPLPGRPVMLLSSRTEDRVSAYASETDANGEITFRVTAGGPGTASLRAIDLLSGNALEDSIDLSVGAPDTWMGGYVASSSLYAPPYAPPAMPSYAPAYVPSYAAQQTWYGPRGPSQGFYGRSLYGQMATFGLVDHFEILVPGDMKVNDPANMSITALDAQGRVVEDYTGTVYVEVTDPLAITPGDGMISFQPRDLGRAVRTLGLIFRTPGMQSIRTVDSVDQRIAGQTDVLVTGGPGDGGERLITIGSPEQDGAVSVPDVVLEGVGPPFINLIVTGGVSDITGETDQAGRFSIRVALRPDLLDHTLRVQDETGRFNSGNLHLTLDATEPPITAITYSPAQPEEGENVLVVAKSEPKLESFTLTIGDETLPFAEDLSSSGTYNLLFAAPAPGAYQPVLVATDRAGNQTELLSTMGVKGKGLPAVKNLIAEAKPNAISLRWDPIQDETVEAYRIYVGDGPANFLYTLETDRATASATVGGLTAGTTYYFAVTAIEGERESKEKSNVVQATVRGLKIDVTPQDESLFLEWSSLPTDIPLSSFLLEYGVEPQNFTESRTLNGDLRAYQLRDLLSGVTYYLRLTPVTTTGEMLKDLSATGEGTPGGAGFSPEAAIPVTPGSILAGGTVFPAPDGGLHGGAPVRPPKQLPSIGIPLPAWWIVGMLSILFLYMHWQRRRQLRTTMDFLRGMNERYHS